MPPSCDLIRRSCLDGDAAPLAAAKRLNRYNPFKSQLIATKVPEGSRTTVYRNGDLIDLCRGPHLPDTGRMKAFSVLRNRCRRCKEKSGGRGDGMRRGENWW